MPLAPSAQGFAAPGLFLGLEAGQAAVFLTTPLNDPQLYMTLLFQLAYSFFKNTGLQMDLTAKVFAMLGRPWSKEQMATKRADLVVIATSHNFAEIMSIVILLLIVAGEAVCYLLGLSENGRLSGVMSNRYRESGITTGWRGCGEIPLGETAVVLMLILVARIVATLCEEKFGSSRYGPRRRNVQDYLNLMFRGPLAFRTMCVGMLLAQVFIFPSEVRSPARLFSSCVLPS